MNENMNASPCEGCGEVHPPISPAQALQAILAEVAAEAARIVEASPGEHERMEELLAMGDRIAQAALMERLMSMIGGQGAPSEGGQDAARSEREGGSADERPGLYL